MEECEPPNPKPPTTIHKTEKEEDRASHGRHTLGGRLTFVFESLCSCSARFQRRPNTGGGWRRRRG
jgi:hypothetical protein